MHPAPVNARHMLALGRSDTWPVRLVAEEDKPIFVHKLVASDTIEDKMDAMKANKRALAERLFDHDGEPILAMIEADLDALFAA